MYIHCRLRIRQFVFHWTNILSQWSFGNVSARSVWDSRIESHYPTVDSWFVTRTTVIYNLRCGQISRTIGVSTFVLRMQNDTVSVDDSGLQAASAVDCIILQGRNHGWKVEWDQGLGPKSWTGCSVREGIVSSCCEGPGVSPPEKLWKLRC